jgi:hypothetical protein
MHSLFDPLDDQTWAIRYLIVKTSNWWLGHKVLLAPQSIQDVSWLESKVLFNLTRQSIKEAPAYDPTVLEGRTQLLRLHGKDGHVTGGLARRGVEQVGAEEYERQRLNDDTDADEEDAKGSGVSS